MNQKTDNIKFTIEISPDNLLTLLEYLTIIKDKTTSAQGMFLDLLKKIVEDTSKNPPCTYDG